MNALTFLLELKKAWRLPLSVDSETPTEASNSEVRRWLKNKAVQINGKRPGVCDEIVFPIFEFVFFPKGKRKTTFT